MSNSKLKIAYSDDQEVINSIVDKEIVELDTKVNQLGEDIKNIELHIPEKGDPGYTPIKGVDYKDGEDYVLTEDDKLEIAQSIEVPIVEKVIEKTKTIVEKPVITEIVKEVAVTDEPKVIANKLNTLKEVLDVEVIKGHKDLLSKKTFDEFQNKVYTKGQVDQRWHGGGLSRVSTDATLTGDGTPSNPLSASASQAAYINLADNQVVRLSKSGAIGQYVGANTDDGRGTALTSAMADLVDGDVLYLCSGTFNISNQGKVPSITYSVIGAGRESTIINMADDVGPTSPKFYLYSSIVTMKDLTLEAIVLGDPAPASNDGGILYLFNAHIIGNEDGFINFGSWAGRDGAVYAYDSIIESGQDILYSGNYYMYNTTLYMNGDVGTGGVHNVAIRLGGNTYVEMYGGKITASATANNARKGIHGENGLAPAGFAYLYNTVIDLGYYTPPTYDIYLESSYSSHLILSNVLCAGNAIYVDGNIEYKDNFSILRSLRNNTTEVDVGYGTTVRSAGFVTQGGLATDFVKGDGSLDGTTYLDTTTAGTTYLKLDQTTPQTTVGTFTFPELVVSNGVTAGASTLLTIAPPASASAVDSLTAGAYARTLSAVHNYRIYSYQDKYNQRLVSSTYQTAQFTVTQGNLDPIASITATPDYTSAGFYLNYLYVNCEIVPYKIINGQKYIDTSVTQSQYLSYSYYGYAFNIDYAWEASTGSDGYYFYDYVGGQWRDVATNSFTDDGTGWTIGTYPTTYTLAATLNVDLSWASVANATGYIIVNTDTPTEYYLVAGTTKTDNDTWSTTPTLTPTSIYNDQHYFYGQLRTNQLNYIGNPALTGDDINYISFGKTAGTGVSIGKGNIAYDGAVGIGQGTFNAVTADSQVTTSTGIGYRALYNILSGSDNVAIGDYAGYLKTASSTSIMIGRNANYDGATSQQSIHIGHYAGYYAQGNANTYIGYQAGSQVSASSGTFNVGVGMLSLYSVTTGTNLVALGYKAGNLATGAAYTTFIGAFAGESLTTGSYNVYIGQSAGNNATTQRFSNYLGYIAGSTCVMADGGGTFNGGNIDYTTGIGTRAMCHRYNGIALGAPDGSNFESNIGLGVIHPMYRLQMSGSAHIGDTVNGLGAEKITNGGFATDTVWTKTTGWAITGGVATHNANGTGTLTQTSANMVTPLVVGETYVLNFTMSAWTVGGVGVACGGVDFHAVADTSYYNQNGRYQIMFKAVSTGALTFTPTNTARFSLDNVSLKKVTGGNLDVVGTTTTGVLNIKGTTTPTGRVMLPMGEISYFSTTGTAVAITTQSDGSTNMVKAAPTTALTSGGYEFDNGGANNGRLRYTGTVTKMFHVAVTYSLSPDSANDLYVIGVAKNGTVLAPSKILTSVMTINDTKSAALHVMVELATNDYLELYVGNTTDADDVVIKTLNIFAMGM